MSQDMENLMIKSESLSGWCVVTVKLDYPAVIQSPDSAVVSLQRYLSDFNEEIIATMSNKVSRHRRVVYSRSNLIPNRQLSN